jgi:hypothetical protein
MKEILIILSLTLLSFASSSVISWCSALPEVGGIRFYYAYHTKSRGYYEDIGDNEDIRNFAKKNRKDNEEVMAAEYILLSNEASLLFNRQIRNQHTKVDLKDFHGGRLLVLWDANTHDIEKFFFEFDDEDYYCQNLLTWFVKSRGFTADYEN